MKGVALLLSLVGLAMGQTASLDFMPICDPEDFGPEDIDLPVPDLPDQFSFTIEGNLIQRNSTVIMTEYYDRPNDRGRLEFGFNGSSGVASLTTTMGKYSSFQTSDLEMIAGFTPSLTTQDFSTLHLVLRTRMEAFTSAHLVPSLKG